MMPINNAIPIIKRMDNTAPLTQTFDNSWQALLASLVRPDFYLEVSLIATAVAVAWGITLLLRHQLARRIRHCPSKYVDEKFVLRAFTVLAPLLAFFALGLMKPFAQRYAGGSDWTAAFMRLMLAFTLARTLILLIRTRLVAYFMASVVMIIAMLEVTGFMQSTRIALDGIAFNFGKFQLSMLGLAQGLIILVVVFWIASLLSRTLESGLQRSHLSYNARALILKFFRIFVYFIAFLLTLSAMGIDLTALAIFGGALGVGVGLGLQRITANFVSGVTLLMEKSIKIGDLIEVAGMSGHVRELNVRYALIETADGRELMIPNEILISTQVTNWTYSNDNARIDIDIHLPFAADGKYAIELMLEAARKHPRCLKNPAPACHLRNFTDYGQHFLLTFWIPDVQEGRYGPQSDVLFTIAERFKQAGISLLDKTEGQDVIKL